MTPVSAVRAAFVLVVALLLLMGADVVVGVDWPARSPEVLRGLAGALAVLAVGAIVFAHREAGVRDDFRVWVALIAGVLGTVATLIAAGLLSAIPDDRADAVFAYPALGGVGVSALILAVVAGSSVWDGRDR